MPKTIIHTASGEFRDEQGRLLIEGQSQGWTMAGTPASPDADFSIVTIPEGVIPDRRSEKWDAQAEAVVAKTAQEIADYDATQPNNVPAHELLDRFTDAEQAAVDAIVEAGGSDARVASRLMRQFAVRVAIDVNSTRFLQGMAWLKSKGVVDDQRILEIRGLA